MTMTIWASTFRSASVRMNARPSMPGICRSVMITSNGLLLDDLQRLDRAGRGSDLVPGGRQHIDHRLAGPGVVIDDEHAADQLGNRRVRGCGARLGALRPSRHP